MKTTQQVLMIGSGLMIAVGFMFGIVANLSSLTPGGQPAGSSGEPQEINAELPNQTYSQSDFGLGVNEQIQLARENQVVFVNAVYNDNSTNFDLEGLDEEFNNRVYVSEVQASNSTIDPQLQLNSYPEVVVIGDQPSGQRGFTLARPQNTTRQSVTSAVCGAMRDLGNSAAICY